MFGFLGQKKDYRERGWRYGPLKAVPCRVVWGHPSSEMGFPPLYTKSGCSAETFPHPPTKPCLICPRIYPNWPYHPPGGKEMKYTHSN